MLKSFQIQRSTQGVKSSGRSRISPRRGRNSRGGGAPTYDFAKFSQKLHEIERISAPGGASLAPPLDPPLKSCLCINLYFSTLRIDTLTHDSNSNCLLLFLNIHGIMSYINCIALLNIGKMIASYCKPFIVRFPPQNNDSSTDGIFNYFLFIFQNDLQSFT